MLPLRKLSKEYPGSLCIPYDWLWIYNYFRKKKFIIPHPCTFTLIQSHSLYRNKERQWHRPTLSKISELYCVANVLHVRWTSNWITTAYKILSGTDLAFFHSACQELQSYTCNAIYLVNNSYWPVNSKRAYPCLVLLTLSSGCLSQSLVDNRSIIDILLIKKWINEWLFLSLPLHQFYSSSNTEPQGLSFCLENSLGSRLSGGLWLDRCGCIFLTSFSSSV